MTLQLCPPSPIADDCSALPFPTSSLSLDASPCVQLLSSAPVLLKVLYCNISMFYLLFLGVSFV